MIQDAQPTRLSVVPTPQSTQVSPVPAAVAERWTAIVDYLNRWFYQPDTQALEIVLTACAAHFDQGCDPLWFQVIGPSGGGKTSTIINPLSDLPNARHVGDLTPRTFLSGFRVSEGQPSASLLHQIGSSGILLFKDFTTFLSKRPEDRAEIASQLREIFDGAFSKDTGGSTVKRWFGKVTILVAATPAIERYWGMHRELGERFLQVRWGRRNGIAAGEMAARQLGHERVISETLRHRVKDFFCYDRIAITPPEVDAIQRRKLSVLAEAVSRLRGHVNRDSYTRQINDMPQIEDSTRAGKSLMSIARFHAALFRKTEIDDLDMEIAKRVAMDTVPANRIRLIRGIPLGIEVNGPALQEITGMSGGVLSYAADDLQSLGAISISKDEACGTNNYEFTDEFSELWREAMS